MQKVALLALRGNPERAAMLQTAEKAGISVVEPSFVEGGSDADYRAFFTASSKNGADALFVDGSPEHITKRRLISELAAEFRLPAIYPFRSLVEVGGLMKQSPIATESKSARKRHDSRRKKMLAGRVKGARKCRDCACAA